MCETMWKDRVNALLTTATGCELRRPGPESVALLRLDTCWCASTRHELTHLHDRLSPGGVLISDDHGCCCSAGSGRIAVRPWA